MPSCPICSTESTEKFSDTPYHICPSCHLWFQYPYPPKVYAGAHEEAGDLMSDADKAANEALAAYLFDDVLKGNQERTLDIGAKYPYLASRLSDRGCPAHAIDGDRDIIRFGRELGVPVECADFETMRITEDSEDLASYGLITLIHVFEHMYDPLAALRKLRRLVADDGRVFIRLPDHCVKGFERDLTPGHYTIHVFFYTFTAILEALVQTNTFVVEHTRALEPGQRDILLRPI